MELRFTVHLDDYHSNITAHWKTREACLAHVSEEIEGGYDVDRITVDGKPLLCRLCREAGDLVLADVHPGAPSELCITHAHFEKYQRDSRAGRYQGD